MRKFILRKEFLPYLFALSIVLAACTSKTMATPVTIVPSIAQTAQYSSLATQTVSPSVTVKSLPVKQTIDGATIELTGYKQENDFFIIEFCFDPPSSETWLFDDVILILDSHEILPKELRYNSGSVDGIPCGSLSFPIEQNIKSGSNVELVIGQLQTDVIHYDCVKAQTKLDQAQPDLVVKVHCFSTEDGEGMRIETIQKPENMSDEEVAGLVRDAFSDVIEVDLRFSFRIENP